MEVISEYELKRRANIERNNKYLQEIGLATRSQVTPTRRESVKKDTKRKFTEIAVPLPTRRSLRVASLPSVNYKEQDIKTEIQPRELIPQNEIAKLKIGEITGFNHTSIVEIPTEASNADSCQSLDAHLDPFLSDYLCQPLEEYGKLAVMTLSNHGKAPKFNKYPGVIEWRNCLYLWVNIGGKTGYVNTFTEQGRYMMWYGGSRMKADSRTTLRLIHPSNRSPHLLLPSSPSSVELHSDEAAAPMTPTIIATAVKSSLESSHRVILFVRLENEGYCCLGEVKYIAMDLEKSPIQIKWELMAFPQLTQREYFQTILKESHLQ